MQKIVCLYSYHQKNVLQEEIKDWTFEAFLSTEETNSWFLLIESLKMTCARSYVWFLNFLDCFSWHVFPKLSNITMTCPKSVEENEWGRLWLAQSQQHKH